MMKLLIDLSFSWEFVMTGEGYASIIILFIVLIVGIIVSIKARRADPLKKPKGILNVAEIGVTTFDNMTKSSMGNKFKKMAPYWFGVAVYMFLGFTLGLVGLPSPMSTIISPLMLSLVTFVMIHFVAARANKWGYFKRYVDPFALFLPINLISMWSPIISLTFRLLGNALAGFSILGLVYWALQNLSNALFGNLLGPAAMIVIPPLITPFLHLYFDLFSAVIQTVVFISLSMMFIASEDPDDSEEESRPLVTSSEAGK
ncbi:MAG: F0F1 ATP synthase subunit A [Bacilli bacterium]|jgi:F-type H+-transporting ATPase subunit a